MNEITSIVYLSRAGVEFSKRDARQHLKIFSQTENAKHEISGLLVYSEGYFLQIIEGTSAAIDTLYAKIVRDPRHSEIDLLTRSVSAIRLFSKWSMGIVETEDSLETNINIDNRLAAIEILRKRLTTESISASTFIEVFLDPQSIGVEYKIA